MAMRRNYVLGVMGLMIALGGFLGCEQTLTSPGTITWIQPKPVPADQIDVRLTGTSAADINGTVVKLYVGSVVLRSRTISDATTTSYTVSFDTLDAGTYQITISKAGFAFLVGRAVLSATVIAKPVVAFTHSAIVTTDFKTVETTQIVNPPNVPTVVTVEPPKVITDATTAPVASTTVSVTGVTNSVTVVNGTQNDVPSVTNTNGDVTTAVVGAVTIDAATVATGASADIQLSVGIDSTQYAAASGGTVNVLRFDQATLTWSNLGAATIGANGTVNFTAGLTAGSNIFAVGTTPIVTNPVATSTALPNALTADQVEARKQAGATTYDYSANATFSQRSGKLAGGARVSGTCVPPGVVNKEMWPILKPIVAQYVPELSQYLEDCSAASMIIRIPFLPGVTQEITQSKEYKEFTFTVKIGGVTKTMYLGIDYVHSEAVIVVHRSGTATSP